MTTSAELCEAAGISRRMMYWWLKRGLLKIRDRHYRCRFDDDQILRALVVRELRKRDMPIAEILRVGYRLTSEYLVIVRGRIFRHGSKGLLRYLKRINAPFTLISMADLRAEAEAARGRIAAAPPTGTVRCPQDGSNHPRRPLIRRAAAA